MSRENVKRVTVKPRSIESLPEAGTDLATGSDKPEQSSAKKVSKDANKS